MRAGLVAGLLLLAGAANAQTPGLSFGPEFSVAPDGKVRLKENWRDASKAGGPIYPKDGGQGVLVGGFAYTLGQARTGGLSIGWGTCLLNIAEAAAIVTTIKSLFLGAGNSSVLVIPPNGWACPSVHAGNYVTLTK